MTMIFTVLETILLGIFPVTPSITIPSGRKVQLTRRLTLSFIVGSNTLLVPSEVVIFISNATPSFQFASHV